MRSFIFLALAFAAFVVVMVAHRLSTEMAFQKERPSSHQETGSSLDPDSLALCLASRGAVLFGAEWCPACRHQEELFGAAASYLEHVDCDQSPMICADAGVRAIPAWEIDGRLHTGVQSLGKLANLSGCRDEAVVLGPQPALPEMPELADWQVSEISYSWRDAKGGFHVTTEPPPKGAIEVEVFR